MRNDEHSCIDKIYTNMFKDVPMGIPKSDLLDVTVAFFLMVSMLDILVCAFSFKLNNHQIHFFLIKKEQIKKRK